ncbi:MAG: MATE family efflux transporter, partial [Desulfocapsaceae bacterium]|nr:MATE family efflux transporter [Desulfocapsaceae bacterium]
TVMEFTDRVFLSNYSIEAISAATPAGISAYLFMAFLGGIGGYCGVFIAQYYGSGQYDRIGSVVWQGIYFCLISAILLLLVAHFLTVPLFRLVGHSPEVRRLEEIYFAILCQGAVFHVAVQTLGAFFSGRGITRPIMTVSIIGMLINIPLDYALIYGIGIVPEMGIRGAAIATVISTAFSMVILVFLVFRKIHDTRFKLFSSFRFETPLFLRLLRFGIPGSMQFSLDILAFTIFILLVGRIGTAELAATNIVLSINAIAFMPSMGVSQGISVMVGRSLGSAQPERARHETWSAIRLLLAYILVVDLLFIFAPHITLAMFIPDNGDAALYEPVITIATNLMRIIACYLFFDALYMIFSGVLRGAGDTRFIMWSVGLAAVFCFLLPLFIGIEILDRGIYFSWSCVLFFIISLFLVSSFRYRSGKWSSMLVIERKNACVPGDPVD